MYVLLLVLEVASSLSEVPRLSMGLGLGEKSRTYVFLQLYVDSRFRLHRRLSRKRSLAQAKLYSYAVAGACITLHLSMCDKHTQPLHIRRRLIKTCHAFVFFLAASACGVREPVEVP